MKPQKIEMLLGGYATGTLTPAERELLLAAALENQALFDALADEEVLRQLLADPSARRQLLTDLADRPAGIWERFQALLRQPATLAIAGSAAALVVMVGVVQISTLKKTEQPIEIAMRPHSAAQPPAQRSIEPEQAGPRGQAAAEVPVVTPRKAPEPPRSRRAEKEEEDKAVPPAAAVAEGAGRQVADAESRMERSVDAMKENAAPRLAAVPPAAPAALSKPADSLFTVLLRDAAGTFRPTDPNAVFRAGDAVRLALRAPDDSYLFVAERDGDVTRNLTPAAGVHLARGQSVTVPEDGALELTGASGAKIISISFSRAPARETAPGAGYQFTRQKTVASVERKAARADQAAAPDVIELRLVYR